MIGVALLFLGLGLGGVLQGLKLARPAVPFMEIVRGHRSIRWPLDAWRAAAARRPTCLCREPYRIAPHLPHADLPVNLR